MNLTDLLRSLPADPRVVLSGNHAVPFHTLGLIDEALDSYRLWVLNAPPGLPDREGVVYETPFVGVGMRHSPRLSYVPCRLSLVPSLFRTTMAPDLVVLHTTRPRAGRVSLGVEVNILPAAIEAARARGAKVVAQVNDRMPWTLGDAEVDVDQIDLLIEADEVIMTAPAPRIDSVSAKIGSLVAARVPDGATLQAGIGAVPDATLCGLTGRRGLKIWTEMFSDSALVLEQAGALDQDTPVQASFLFGSAELLDWVDGNHRVRMIRTETSNDPALISRNPSMVSVNTALQVDLFGQANASRVHSKIYSGFGGQTDFIVGALHSCGGQALIALRSWHPRADVSTIVPVIEEPVTSFQMTAVVTEQGVAEVFGLDQRHQAANIIDHAAHPRVREQLWEQAVPLGLARPLVPQT
ncbi:MAG TPA: acetyl-CoA hydrolase/transferase C-terminal domain-containing protein [Marmoricola sp.]|nr:acetyl-CoA hydrolase/transferase C-terminal domain-containing protein [Marmoricola sp.]